MFKRLVVLFLLLFFVLLNISCEKSGDKADLEIIEVESTPTIVGPERTARIMAYTRYNGDDDLIFDWSSDHGELVEMGDSAFWTAPAEVGSYWVWVSVFEERSFDDDSILITVHPDSTGYFNLLRIRDFDIDDTVDTDTRLPITFSYIYDGDREVTSSLTFSDGSTDWESDESTWWWNVPDYEGTQTFEFIITDDVLADTLTGSVYVVENILDTLEITWLGIDPASVVPNDTSHLNASYYYTGDNSLTYSWRTDAGEIWGSISSATWVAPDSIGEFHIWYNITDGSVYDSSFVNVLVYGTEDTLEITAVTALNDTIYVDESTYLSGSVNYTGSSSLTYSWFGDYGVFDPHGLTCDWTAPSVDGSYEIGFAVTDGSIADTAYITIIVLEHEISDTLEITAVTALNDTIYVDESTYLSGSVNYTGSSSLTYSWFGDYGVFDPHGLTCDWTAPSVDGNYEIGFAVTDGSLSDTAYITIIVLEHEISDTLEITAITALNDTIYVDESTYLSGSVNYTGSSSLTYSWFGGYGIFDPHGLTCDWTAPSVDGSYEIGFAVSDGSIADTAYITIIVIEHEIVDTLEITAVTALNDTIYVDEGTYLSGSVNYTGSSSLTYSWFGDYGVFDPHGITCDWTAPSVDGSYEIGFAVTDGSLTDTAYITIIVIDHEISDTLEITGVYATDDTIYVDESTYLSGSVHYSGSSSLTYSWFGEHGTFDPHGLTCDWRAPIESGSYDVGFAVTDGSVADTAYITIVVVDHETVDTLEITALTALNDTIYVDESTYLSVSVNYTGSLSLTYNWFGDYGVFSPHGVTCDWTAPSVDGSYDVGLAVTDGTLADTAYITIIVLEHESSDTLEITAVTALNDTVYVGESTYLSGSVTYSGSSSLTYSWFGDDGVFDPHGLTCDWTAPSEAGSYEAGFAVTDGTLSDTAFVTIVVINHESEDTLEIMGVYAVHDTIYVDESTYLSGSVDYSGSHPLIYSWFSDYGTLDPHGLTCDWRAPSEPGSYEIGFTVTDGSISDTSYITVVVIEHVSTDTLEITSILATSDTVVITETTYLSGMINYTGELTLTYSWFSDGGILDPHGITCEWTAPTMPGDYEIGFVVSDGVIVDTSYITIVVINHVVVDTLEITSVFATDDTIYVGEDTYLSSLVHYTGALSLTYSWFGEDGIFDPHGLTCDWTAPDVAGMYDIGFAVTDGSLADTSGITIWVIETDDTLEILTMTIDEDTIYLDENTDITLTYRYTGDSELSSEWVSSSGNVVGDTLHAVFTPDESGDVTIMAIISDGEISDTIYGEITVLPVIDHVSLSPHVRTLEIGIDETFEPVFISTEGETLTVDVSALAEVTAEYSVVGDFITVDDFGTVSAIDSSSDTGLVIVEIEDDRGVIHTDTAFVFAWYLLPNGVYAAPESVVISSGFTHVYPTPDRDGSWVYLPDWIHFDYSADCASVAEVGWGSSEDVFEVTAVSTGVCSMRVYIVLPDTSYFVVVPIHILPYSGVGGTVNNHLGDPIFGATVRVERGDGSGLYNEASTNSWGYFNISEVWHGTREIIIQYDGFEDITDSIEVTPGGTYGLEYNMIPE